MDEMVDGHEFEQVLGVGDGQGSLACRSLWGCNESYTAEHAYIPYNEKHVKQGYILII